MRTHLLRAGLVALLLIASPRLLTAQTLSTMPLSEAFLIDGIDFAPDGSLVAATGWSGRVLLRISPDGVVTTLADGLAGPIHSVRDAEGRIYVTNYSDAGSVAVIEPGAGTARKLADVPRGAAGIALGPDGDVYVSIYGSPQGDGDSIWRVTPDGHSEEFVSGDPIAAPIGLAFDDAGLLYAVNSRDGKILRIDPAGNVELHAALPSGEGFFASGHLVFGNGVLYASGNHHHQVYEVSLAGEVKVLAGTGEPGRVDGPAGTGQLTIPNGLALSPDGSRLVVVPGGPNPREFLRVIQLR